MTVYTHIHIHVSIASSLMLGAASAAAAGCLCMVAAGISDFKLINKGSWPLQYSALLLMPASWYCIHCRSHSAGVVLANGACAILTFLFYL